MHQLMEIGSKCCKVVSPKVFSNAEQTSIADKRFANYLGNVWQMSCFEFVHVVLTHNTNLNKHLDLNNNNHVGYNKCIVCCFYETVWGVMYQSSAIMTTRYTINAAFEGISALERVAQNITSKSDV